MTYKTLYRFLVSVRRWLNTLIDWTRARAFPQTEGKRRRKVALPTEAQLRSEPELWGKQ